MKVSILDMVERTEYPTPLKKVVYVDIYYQTERGFKGHITLEKALATPDAIRKGIKEDAAKLDQVAGSTLEI